MQYTMARRRHWHLLAMLSGTAPRGAAVESFSFMHALAGCLRPAPRLSRCCRWQLMELAAGKVKSKPVKSAHGATDVIQWTFATAAANHLNVVRAFAHGTDSSFPLQTSAGAALGLHTR